MEAVSINRLNCHRNSLHTKRGLLVFGWPKPFLWHSVCVNVVYLISVRIDSALNILLGKIILRMIHRYQNRSIVTGRVLVEFVMSFVRTPNFKSSKWLYSAFFLLTVQLFLLFASNEKPFFKVCFNVLIFNPYAAGHWANFANTYK